MSSHTPFTPPGSSGSSTPRSIASPSEAELPDGQPGAASGGKLRTSKRLLRGFQRISSYPSLSRTGTFSSYRSGGHRSSSCLSVSSAGSPYGASHHRTDSFASSQTSYSTAPTSVASSPCQEAPSPHRRQWMKTIGVGSFHSRITAPHAQKSALASFGPELEELQEEYISRQLITPKQPRKRENFSLWTGLPPELQVYILRFLPPRELVRCSIVSRSWHSLCFDGQIWGTLDTADYYRDISADGLCKIIKSAGPFVRDLNLRGCVQLRERWNSRGLADACRNLEYFSLEGCRIDRTTIHTFLLQNHRLVHINLSGLAGASNSTLRILAQQCPQLEHLNVSWCGNVDSAGIRYVVEGCASLRDLRAGEIGGWDDEELMQELFRRNTLERLVLKNCSLTDEALATLLLGPPDEREFDILTGRPLTVPRKLKDLDFTFCRRLTDDGVLKLAYTVPDLEGLQLAKCPELTDSSLTSILPTFPRLTHLDLEELSELTNDTLTCLAAAPCAKHLKHLSVSSCDGLGDQGMVPLIKSCRQLRTIDMDNTRISDLVLIEAAALIRDRNLERLSKAQSGSRAIPHKLRGQAPPAPDRPRAGLRIFAYDCANVTWCGVREVLSRNAEILRQPAGPPRIDPQTKRYEIVVPQPYHRDIIQLKCFYNWQPTVEEHTKRVMRCDFAAAARLERKWADWMALGGAGDGIDASGASRRRRRRAREAQLLHGDEETGNVGLHAAGINDADAGAGGAALGGVGRRRRARSGPGGCTVM